jgi:DnaJ-class molecular chaperone
VNPALVLASLILAIAGGCALLCASAPWTRCSKCSGAGRKPGHTGKLLRSPCRRCDGSGIRIRIGRRVFTWIDREYRHGTSPGHTADRDPFRSRRTP